MDSGARWYHNQLTDQGIDWRSQSKYKYMRKISTEKKRQGLKRFHFAGTVGGLSVAMGVLETVKVAPECELWSLFHLVLGQALDMKQLLLLPEKKHWQNPIIEPIYSPSDWYTVDLIISTILLGSNDLELQHHAWTLSRHTYIQCKHCKHCKLTSMCVCNVQYNTILYITLHTHKYITT